MSGKQAPPPPQSPEGDAHPLPTPWIQGESSPVEASPWNSESEGSDTVARTVRGHFRWVGQDRKSRQPLLGGGDIQMGRGALSGEVLGQSLRKRSRGTILIVPGLPAFGSSFSRVSDNSVSYSAAIFFGLPRVGFCLFLLEPWREPPQATAPAAGSPGSRGPAAGLLSHSPQLLSVLICGQEMWV